MFFDSYCKVGQRKLPRVNQSSPPPKVLMKMDIEGSEVDVIPDLLSTGTLQYVNTIMVEWHGWIMASKKKNDITYLKRALKKYSVNKKRKYGEFRFKLVNLDDESYGTTKYKFPMCKI